MYPVVEDILAQKDQLLLVFVLDNRLDEIVGWLFLRLVLLLLEEAIR